MCLVKTMDSSTASIVKDGDDNGAAVIVSPFNKDNDGDNNRAPVIVSNDADKKRGAFIVSFSIAFIVSLFKGDNNGDNNRAPVIVHDDDDKNGGAFIVPFSVPFIVSLFNIKTVTVIAALVAVAVTSPPQNANAEIATGLSSEVIELTTAFAGSELLLFGALEQDQDDVIVIVRGPPAPQTLFRRESILGLWLTTEREKFTDVPGYYAVAASRPLAEIATPELRDRLEAEASRLKLSAENGNHTPAAQWRIALLRRMEAEGLYHLQPGAVSLTGSRLFEARFPVPPAAREGVYEILVHRVRGGTLAESTALHFAIQKAGVSARLAALAQEQPALYALLGLLMSLTLGLLGYALAGRR